MSEELTTNDIASLWATLTYAQRTVLMGGVAAWPDTLTFEERLEAEVALEVQNISRNEGVGHALVSFGTHILLVLELLNEDQTAVLKDISKGNSVNENILTELRDLGLIEGTRLSPVGIAVLEFSRSTRDRREDRS